jgi:hypothetical protein
LDGDGIDRDKKPDGDTLTEVVEILRHYGFAPYFRERRTPGADGWSQRR